MRRGEEREGISTHHIERMTDRGDSALELNHTHRDAQRENFSFEIDQFDGGGQLPIGLVLGLR
jgi:hypothetical protein